MDAEVLVNEEIQAEPIAPEGPSDVEVTGEELVEEVEDSEVEVSEEIKQD